MLNFKVLVGIFLQQSVFIALQSITENGHLASREVRGSHPGPATILLGSNLGQVVYSHCLPSLLGSKKLGYKWEYVFHRRRHRLIDSVVVVKFVIAAPSTWYIGSCVLWRLEKYLYFITRL